MWRNRFIVLILVALHLPAAASGQDGAIPSGQDGVVAFDLDEEARAEASYSIQPGDVLEISVWSEPELEREVLVAPDGMISFPLAGEISALNRSVTDIRLEIAERLARYLADPLVTVTVSEVLGNKIYVLGQVASPGAFVVNPQVDVMQALSMAGGATAYASLKDIVILRRQGPRQIAIDFRYDDIVSGRNLDQNIVLESGDIVVVP